MAVDYEVSTVALLQTFEQKTQMRRQEAVNCYTTQLFIPGQGQFGLVILGCNTHNM